MAAFERGLCPRQAGGVGGARSPRRLSIRGLCPRLLSWGRPRRGPSRLPPKDLGVDEVRRPAVEEGRAVGLGPGHEPIERLAPEEGPHRGPMDEEVLHVLRPELMAVLSP